MACAPLVVTVDVDLTDRSDWVRPGGGGGGGLRAVVGAGEGVGLAAGMGAGAPLPPKFFCLLRAAIRSFKDEN